jgi:hypothetical protein
MSGACVSIQKSARSGRPRSSGKVPEVVLLVLIAAALEDAGAPGRP